MQGDRARKQRATEYMEGYYRIQERGTGNWMIIDDCVHIGSLPTLNEARSWCKSHPADPDFGGKYSSLDDPAYPADVLAEAGRKMMDEEIRINEIKDNPENSNH